MSPDTGSEGRDYFFAHQFSSYHRAEITQSEMCGCFCCLKTFTPKSIKKWTDKNKEGVGQTALCPKCGTDSVLGTKAGFPLTPEFLRTMQEYWFKSSKATGPG